MAAACEDKMASPCCMPPYGKMAAGALVQYVVLRGDLRREPLSWPLGALAPDECALSALTETLQQNGIDHKVWVEQPENIATCLALRPYPKETVHRYLKKFRLLK
ncbi:hypothetical protein JD844_025806 [Phrynosoma platyrhinos]|uniref:peptidyl-tRNA hydrolase n=1 Tax=Phrynosoma platyrhinos TaxID=52577 RepID=A0ABQ7SZL3_PHRPL|nr:hypothetical protein JD844_025806 [Phrynosoma platyrhinos]